MFSQIFTIFFIVSYIFPKTKHVNNKINKRIKKNQKLLKRLKKPRPWIKYKKISTNCWARCALLPENPLSLNLTKIFLTTFSLLSQLNKEVIKKISRNWDMEPKGLEILKSLGRRERESKGNVKKKPQENQWE